MEDRYYFAYGSNMNLEQMKYRCPAAEVVENVRLENYRLAFRGRAPGNGVATVLPEKYRLTLKPLQGRDEKTAIDTLSAYLIDADKNIAATAKYLHVHESTVKYRLNNIKRKLGYDIAEMPGVYSLYKALALNRLLHARNNIKY